MSAITIPGLGPHIEVEDAEGCRHLIKTAAISMFSDVDGHHTECVLVVNGRPLRIERPRDEILEEVRQAQAEAIGY